MLIKKGHALAYHKISCIIILHVFHRVNNIMCLYLFVTYYYHTMHFVSTLSYPAQSIINSHQPQDGARDGDGDTDTDVDAP
jgi:hypothetical protein